MDLGSVSVYKHAKKEQGQYPAILTSHLVNNSYIPNVRVLNIPQLKLPVCYPRPRFQWVMFNPEGTHLYELDMHMPKWAAPKGADF